MLQVIVQIIFDDVSNGMLSVPTQERELAVGWYILNTHRAPAVYWCIPGTHATVMLSKKSMFATIIHNAPLLMDLGVRKSSLKTIQM